MRGPDWIKNASIKYLAGTSIILGNKNRICLNGGLAFGFVNKLSDALGAERIYPAAYKPEIVSHCL
jgi:hypothetical protein